MSLLDLPGSIVSPLVEEGVRSFKLLASMSFWGKSWSIPVCWVSRPSFSSVGM